MVKVSEQNNLQEPSSSSSLSPAVNMVYNILQHLVTGKWALIEYDILNPQQHFKVIGDKQFDTEMEAISFAVEFNHQWYLQTKPIEITQRNLYAEKRQLQMRLKEIDQQLQIVMAPNIIW